MKQFTIIKVGYTAGVYGNTGEYFNCIFFDKKGMDNFFFMGQYGAEDRISAQMQKLGYEYNHSGSRYGKLTRDDTKIFMSEYTALEYIKQGFKSETDLAWDKIRAWHKKNNKQLIYAPLYELSDAKLIKYANNLK